MLVGVQVPTLRRDCLAWARKLPSRSSPGEPSAGIEEVLKEFPVSALTS
jgi:hypothetical protein